VAHKSQPLAPASLPGLFPRWPLLAALKLRRFAAAVVPTTEVPLSFGSDSGEILSWMRGLHFLDNGERIRRAV